MFYNIVDNYNWTTTRKNNLARTKVPYIHLVEYRQSASALEQSVTFWYGQAEQIASQLDSGVALTDVKSSPYENLYIAEPTGNEYYFPFYAPYHHVITNNWGENKGPLGEMVDKLIVPVAKVLKPSAGIETAKAWEGTNAASYTFGFDLLNTVDPDNDIKQNKDFLKEFLTQNLQNRLNSVAALPPAIYTVNIPGVRSSPAAIISNLTVDNFGQINYQEGENTPDAYRVNIQVTELIVESQQIFENPGKVTAIVSRDDESTITLEKGVQAIKDVATELGSQSTEKSLTSNTGDK